MDEAVRDGEKSAVERWRKKPVVIETMQLDDTYERGAAVMAWVTKHGGKVVSSSTNPTWGKFYGFAIHTLEGAMSAGPGDWIIRGVHGEFYPCDPAVFAASYERAHEVCQTCGWVDDHDPEDARCTPSPDASPGPLASTPNERGEADG